MGITSFIGYNMHEPALERPTLAHDYDSGFTQPCLFLELESSINPSNSSIFTLPDMSIIGCNVSEFIALANVIHTSYNNFKKAPNEYDEFAREIRSFQDAIRRLRHEAKNRNSLLDDRSLRELKRITKGCEVVLHDANEMLAKYETLTQDGNAGAAKKLWKQFLFGTTIKDHPAIRGKLLIWTADLSVSLQQIQLQDLGEVKATTSRVEATLEASTSRMITEFAELKQEVRRFRDPNASVSSLSTYAGDDKDVWRDIFRDSRRDAVRLGYTSENLKKHRNDLQGHLLGFFQQHTPSHFEAEEAVDEVEHKSEIHRGHDTTIRPAHSSKYENMPTRTDGREHREERGGRHQKRKVGEQTDIMEESSSLPRLDKSTPPAKTIAAELVSKVKSRVRVPELTDHGPNSDEGLIQSTPAPSFTQALKLEKLSLPETHKEKDQVLECCTDHRTSISSEQGTARCKYSPGLKSLASHPWGNNSDIANVHESLCAFAISWLNGSFCAEKEGQLGSSDFPGILPWSLLFSDLRERDKTILIKRFHIKRLVVGTCLENTDGRMQMRMILLKEAVARRILTRKTTLFLIRLSVVENILVDLFDDHLEIERQREKERQREAERQSEAERRVAERKREAAREYGAERQQDTFSMMKRRLQETIDGRELGRPQTRVSNEYVKSTLAYISGGATKQVRLGSEHR